MFRWKVSARNIRCVLVMPALVAGIHVFLAAEERVDARHGGRA
jgi:hypothetical protein